MSFPKLSNPSKRRRFVRLPTQTRDTSALPYFELFLIHRAGGPATACITVPASPAPRAIVALLVPIPLVHGIHLPLALTGRRAKSCTFPCTYVKIFLSALGVAALTGAAPPGSLGPALPAVGLLASSPCRGRPGAAGGVVQYFLHYRPLSYVAQSLVPQRLHCIFAYLLVGNLELSQSVILTGRPALCPGWYPVPPSAG